MCGNCKVTIEPTTSLAHEGIVKEGQYFHNGDEIFEALDENTLCENEECNKKFSKDKINLIIQSSSYLKYNNDKNNKKLWTLYCSTYNKVIKTFDDYVSIDDLKSKANDNNVCEECEVPRIRIEEINVNELTTYASKFPLTIIGNCDTKFDYDINSTVYTNYSSLQCSKGHSLSDTMTALVNNKTRPQNLLFNEIYCQRCNQSFTAQNINVTSYFYPENNITRPDVVVHCSNCNYYYRNSGVGFYDLNFYEHWNSVDNIHYEKMREYSFNCLQRNALRVWDDDYIKGELVKIQKKNGLP